MCLLIIFVFLFSLPWRWPHEWPKNVGDHYAIKLNPRNKNAFVVFNYFMHLINARNMKHFEHLTNLNECHSTYINWATEQQFYSKREKSV